MSVSTQKKLVYVGILLGVGVVAFWFIRGSSSDEGSGAPTKHTGEEPSIRGKSLAIREENADKRFWASEILAQKYGRIFELLWDEVNARSNKLGVIAGFRVPEVVLPQWESVHNLAHGITLREGKAPGVTLSTDQWRPWVQKFASEGWELDNLELRHNRFDTDKFGHPFRSQFYFAARLSLNAGSANQRAILEGDLAVDWAPTPAGEGLESIKRIDGSHLTLKTRSGETLFQPILQEVFLTRPSDSIDPLILYDLDGDGLSEIILAAKNLVYHRQPNGDYEAQLLCAHPLEFVSSALVADFDGDGAADLLCANSKGLFLFKGSARGTFDEPARLVWAASPPLKNAMVLTCGDVDQDGDLDVFVGQYRIPTMAQIIRPHYYDANDGWPCHLLMNDGHANFTDATEAAGLGQKRWRRTYSASFVDLDGDGHLDLAVVSDFAGLDLYRNDGHGHFSDVTSQWIGEPHAFGMAHAVADFNADGRPDLLMIGMTSPAVDRLEHLVLYRPYSDEDRVMRPAMTFGNRLYLGRPNGGFGTNLLSASIARSGWSWGCSALDFDNDGFPDVYVANGLESKQSVRDYEAEFWLHDMFVGEEVDDATVTGYFMEKFGRTRGSGLSYGGYEKNRLFLNLRGESFVEIGHLAGVSLEQDSRNVVADDLDGDGRVDLLVTTLEVWPQLKQTLQVYKNRVDDAGHWIGFRFREQNGGKSPVGATVTLRYQGRSAVRQIITGDSHRSQHSNTLHFGLGDADKVDRAEIRWVSGSTMVLTRPDVNHYHEVSPP